MANPAQRPRTSTHNLLDAPRVAVLVDTATGWGRRLVQGVCRYGHEHGPWHLLIRAKGQDEPLRVPRGWAGDGVIARISNPAIARHVRQLRVPVINISNVRLPESHDMPCVASDVNATAELAVDHFVHRGFRHFAYSGAERFAYVREHRQAFAAALARHGYHCSVDRAFATPRSVADHESLQRGLVQWVMQLPKPVAIFTWATQRGFDLLDACRDASLVVPHDVAVLGGDYDEVLNEASSPPMSGVITASEQIGLEAAAILDHLMRGHAPPPQPIYLEPLGIMERPSTETLAVDDPDLLKVMRFLDERAFDPITMADILRAVPIARRTLERKFGLVFGRSPTDEIRHRRIARAKRLLADTDLPTPAIADACGFCSYAYLSHVFKQETGTTPTAYRRQVQGR